jgi:hypothetical protein
MPIVQTKPSGRAQFPKFVLTRRVRINWRGETRRIEENLVVVIEMNMDLQLIVKPIALSPPAQTLNSTDSLRHSS